jgi:hypothetical protein
MSFTTDRADPGLREIGPNGQQKVYLILSEEERAIGFVRPVRYSYRHLRCGVVTRMDRALCETYARDPKFYGATYCVGCSAHFPLRDARPEAKAIDDWAFLWEPDGDPVGSTAEEAIAFFAERQREMAERDAGTGI